MNNKIRGFDWLFFGDGTDTGQHTIKTVEVDPQRRRVELEISSGSLVPVITALQENSIIYAQATEGLYRIEYRCSFKHLDATCFPHNRRRVSLGLVVLTFLPGVTTHDKIIN